MSKFQIKDLADKQKMKQIISNNLINKYSHKPNDKNPYEGHIVEILIYNKNCHYSSLFKDCMLYDYLDEFLKRYYIVVESRDRVPKMAKYYLNYLIFFCKPTFRELKVNFVLKKHGDNRAELYYLNNYGKNDVSKSENEEKMNISLHHRITLLTKTIREDINRNSITTDSCLENTKSQLLPDCASQNQSMNFTQLNHHDETFKSGLLSKRSTKEESLANILYLLDPVNINEQFLVKDKMNFKKTFLSNHNNEKTISNVDRTTKDYSIKTINPTKDIKDNVQTEFNNIEIKEIKSVETKRENKSAIHSTISNNFNKMTNDDKSNCTNASPVKYSRLKEFKNLKVGLNYITNIHTNLNNNVDFKADISNVNMNIINNNKTRNKLTTYSRLNEVTGCTTLNFNAYRSTIKPQITQTLQHQTQKNITPVKTNLFLEKIQKDTIRALKEIKKKTKLEFKNIGSANKEGEKELNNNKIIYLETSTNNNNTDMMTLSSLLALTLNTKNSRNILNTETLKSSTNKNMFTNTNNNQNFTNTNSSRRKENQSQEPNCNENNIATNSIVTTIQNNSKKIILDKEVNSKNSNCILIKNYSLNCKDRNNTKPTNKSSQKSLSKSPSRQNKTNYKSKSSIDNGVNIVQNNKKNAPSNYNTNSNTNTNNINILTTIVDQTNNFSRNKNLSLVGIHTNTQNNFVKSYSKNNNLLISTKEPEVNMKNVKIKRYKSNITKTSVNLNIPISKMEDLETKIFGTFSENNKQISEVVNEGSSDTKTVKKKSTIVSDYTENKIIKSVYSNTSHSINNLGNTKKCSNVNLKTTNYNVTSRKTNSSKTNTFHKENNIKKTNVKKQNSAQLHAYLNDFKKDRNTPSSQLNILYNKNEYKA